MSDFNERIDEERLALMEAEEFTPRTAYEAYLTDLGRPDFERGVVGVRPLTDAAGLPV